MSLSALPSDFQFKDVMVAMFEVPQSPICASEQQMAPSSGELGRQGDGDVCSKERFLFPELQILL